MFAEWVEEQVARADAVAAEVQAITARIERLQEQAGHQDPVFEPDEIEAAIDRAEQKRRELAEA